MDIIDSKKKGCCVYYFQLSAAFTSLYFSCNAENLLNNRTLITGIVILACISLFSAGCSEDKALPAAPVVEPWGKLDITASVAKWRDGRTAAVSITYDGLWHSSPLVMDAADDALSRGLPI